MNVPETVISARHGNQLVDYLLGRCKVEAREYEAALRIATTEGKRIELVLRERNLVSDEQLALATADYLGLAPISLAHFTPDEQLLRWVPEKVKTELGILPLARWNNLLTVAMLDPFDLEAAEEARKLTGCDILSYIAPEGDVRRLLQQVNKSAECGLENVLRDVSNVEPQYDAELSAEDDLNVEEMLDLSEEEPVVRIVNSILMDALEKKASDIHIEPMADALYVRYRIDGVLYDEPRPPRHLHWPIVSRLKIIAKLDIAERRLAQDGRFSIRAFGRDAEVRMSVMPTVDGQKVVLRLLDKEGLKPSIEALGIDREACRKIHHAIHQPHGMILVTGPTGSGKTTTLYSILQELNNVGVNIVTVEDPVEYRLPRINQVQIYPQIGLTFAGGLRTILRQDPDIVMVGEIRDSESASIAVQAALTGHLVLSTVHTNDAAGAISRLIHMGIEPFLISSSLIMTQAQRIYRKLCRVCKKRRPMPREIMRLHNMDPMAFSDTVFYGPEGCVQCNGIGYAGREAIMEILPINDEIRELILHRTTAGAIRRQAVADGMRTLRDEGLSRVRSGDTSIEEIVRITREV